MLLKMVEIENPHREIERFEKPKVDISPIKRKSNSKTFRGYLSGCIAKAKIDKNEELKILFETILDKFNKFYPERIIATEITIIDGWKGKDFIDIYKGFDNDFRIKVHIKSKETGEVSESIKEVKKEDLNRMVFVIKKLTINEPVKCYKIAEMLGYDWKEVWKERTEIYFKSYYYPTKILEKLGVISYTGRGVITKLK